MSKVNQLPFHIGFEEGKVTWLPLLISPSENKRLKISSNLQ
jgi:hypothetical protein